MEVLKKISNILKKLVGISAFLVALAETILFLDGKVDEAIKKKEEPKNENA